MHFIKYLFWNYKKYPTKKKKQNVDLKERFKKAFAYNNYSSD